MSSQSSGTHGQQRDDELKHEAQSVVQGHGSGHVEEWRQSTALPDDTADAEAAQALGVDGDLQDSTRPGATDQD
jgi:hypothetical protein